jgi:hypothetical protein
MANITPVQVWYKGEQHNANIFTLYSKGDNLLDSAYFQYQLIEEIVADEQTTSQTVLVGEISINGADYVTWNTEVDANAWIYNWAAQKLNLTLLLT